jgi:hypothetical protein
VPVLAAVAILASAPMAIGAERVVPMAASQIITPKDFTPVEADYFKTLDGDAAKAFLVTRSWVRLAVAVVEGRLPALQFPDKPTSFSIKYLLPTDANYINRAIGMSIHDEQFPGQPYLAHDMTPAQLLSASDLNSAEQSKFQTLTSESDRKNFLQTRSYIRLCRAVVSHSMQPETLPLTPLGYDRAYLVDDDADVAKQALALSLQTSMSATLKP